MNEDMHTKKPAQKKGRSRGGEARAKALPAARRQEIGKAAAAARWSVRIAEYGDEEHPLSIGGVNVPCYVLDDGERVLSQRGFFDALGITSRGGEMERFISHTALDRYLPPDSIKALLEPVRFQPPRSGKPASGYSGPLLVDVCTAVLESRDAGTLSEVYTQTVIRADVLIRAVAKVGIIALIDEATGYTRAELLQTLLQKFLREELARWTKLFPDEFYEQIFRLRNWPWKGRQINPPGVVAYYTKDIVYARLTPGILEKLEQLNPKVGKYRRHKHTQFLTEDFGVPALNQHLATVLTFMRGSKTWDEFKAAMDKFLPRHAENLKLPLLEWGKEQIADEDGDDFRGK